MEHSTKFLDFSLYHLKLKNQISTPTFSLWQMLCSIVESNWNKIAEKETKPLKLTAEKWHVLVNLYCYQKEDFFNK